MRRSLLFVACLAVAGIASAQPAQQKQLEPGPSNNTELGLVIATGNARSTSVGLRNVYIYRWPNAEFGWEAGWLQAASRGRRPVRRRDPVRIRRRRAGHGGRRRAPVQQAALSAADLAAHRLVHELRRRA
jgi:hypothetical protein